MAASDAHVPHGKRKIAYHIEWEFRTEAGVWTKGRAVRPNFYAFGTELRKWMLRKECDLPVFQKGDGWYTNPYTIDTSVLALAYREITNDVFTDAPAEMHPHAAEIRRVRLYSEFVLYTARLCEAMGKQLLFATDFPEAIYRGSALGALVTQDCAGCRPSKEKRHRLSLLGSLAHKYGLCVGYEKCLEELLPMVNKLRDSQAAHSGVEPFHASTATDSHARLKKQADELGHEFLHMLEHVGEIEQKMWEDLMSRITSPAASV
jgi:hypothetical protein